MTKPPFALLLTGCLLISGCQLAEKYLSPDLPIVEGWEKSETDKALSTVPSDPFWWRGMKDATLDRLMTQAVQGNLDIKIAEARLAEARALTQRASAQLMPEIGLAGSLAQEGGQASRGGSDDANTRGEVGLSGSWNLDLFGGLSEEAAASEANLGNAEATRRLTVQTLLADIARTYVDVRAQQQLLALTEKNLTLQKETLRATRIQFEAKAAAKLDLLRAQAQVSRTKAEIPTIVASLAARQHRIAVLMGDTPESVDIALKKSAPVPVFSGDIVLQTPIWTMVNRPDIQAAEYRLREQAALKNARTADLFPKLSLSGFFGLGTSSLYSSATPWSLGANLLSPLLNFGRIESEIDAADARKMQALHRYRKTVLEALEQVENALVQYTQQKKRMAWLGESASSQREAARMARLKYEAGDGVFIDVLIAEERLLQAESAVAQSKAAVTRAAIDLYTAMGVVAPVETVQTTTPTTEE